MILKILMKKLLSLSLILASLDAFAIGRMDVSYGYFAINAKTADTSSSISNPTAFNLGYLMPLMDKADLSIGYSLLLADFAGSDKAFGLNLGVNYFPTSSAKDETLKTDDFNVERYQIWKPYVGLGFYQRNFQSIKTSYAGLGLNAGVEKYKSKKMSYKGELRYITLSGSSESTATEINLFFGLIFKI